MIINMKLKLSLLQGPCKFPNFIDLLARHPLQNCFFLLSFLFVISFFTYLEVTTLYSNLFLRTFCESITIFSHVLCLLGYFQELDLSVGYTTKSNSKR